jgi:hypothetical protein
MLAFFDALLQRELHGQNDDSDGSLEVFCISFLYGFFLNR